LLIVDEFSMVDNLLFYNLLKACGAVRKIIIIGDSDQLPSVNSGALLRDFIECDLFKVVKLEKIYRQKEGSDIITLASDIRLEQCDEINTENDIRFYQCDPVEVRRLILQVVERAVNSFDNQFEGFMNVQVLAPKYKGPNGIDNLNVELQKKFNPYSPSKKQLKVGYRTFRENDKILQLKNQPDDDVYNGDIGIITEIVPAEEDFDGKNRIIADFDGVIVEYTSDTFSNIALGYCISVHKSQGSEYPIVIVPILPEYSFMLQKRLVYTAVTRANRNLIMLGNRELFFKAIRQHDNYQRRTTMKQRLEKSMMPQF
ncbi:MAG: AAA family ATPase, partial [Erysipelotrichaceae bacterium]|nr:AAA family ATPase [Erysipelotrichaceae bacterium]